MASEMQPDTSIEEACSSRGCTPLSNEADAHTKGHLTWKQITHGVVSAVKLPRLVKINGSHDGPGDGKEVSPKFVRTRKRFRTVTWRYRKTIGTFGSFVFLVNQIFGAGLVSIPSVIRASGWLPCLLCNIFLCAVSATCTLMLIRATTMIPGNQNFEQRFEYSAILRYYLSHRVANWVDAFYHVGVQCGNIVCIIAVAQAFDQIFVGLTGSTLGLHVYPPLHPQSSEAVIATGPVLSHLKTCWLSYESTLGMSPPDYSYPGFGFTENDDITRVPGILKNGAAAPSWMWPKTESKWIPTLRTFNKRELSGIYTGAIFGSEGDEEPLILAITLGYIVTALVCIRLSAMNLEENMKVQFISFCSIMIIISYLCGASIFRIAMLPRLSDGVPESALEDVATRAKLESIGWETSPPNRANVSPFDAWGVGIMTQFPSAFGAYQFGPLLTSFLDGYQYIISTPPWANEITDDVRVSSIVWKSTLFASLWYYVFGILLATAFPMVAESGSNILHQLLIASSPAGEFPAPASLVGRSDDGGFIGCFFSWLGYGEVFKWRSLSYMTILTLYGFILLTVLPTIVTTNISTRYNLINTAVFSPAFSFIIACIGPFGLAWFMASEFIADVLGWLSLWTGLICNYITPFTIFIIACRSSRYAQLNPLNTSKEEISGLPGLRSLGSLEEELPAKESVNKSSKPKSKKFAPTLNTQVEGINVGGAGGEQYQAKVREVQLALQDWLTEFAKKTDDDDVAQLAHWQPEDTTSNAGFLQRRFELKSDQNVQMSELTTLPSQPDDAPLDDKDESEDLGQGFKQQLVKALSRHYTGISSSSSSGSPAVHNRDNVETSLPASLMSDVAEAAQTEAEKRANSGEGIEKNCGKNEDKEDAHLGDSPKCELSSPTTTIPFRRNKIKTKAIRETSELDRIRAQPLPPISFENDIPTDMSPPSICVTPAHKTTTVLLQQDDLFQESPVQQAPEVPFARSSRKSETIKVSSGSGILKNKSVPGQINRDSSASLDGIRSETGEISPSMSSPFHDSLSTHNSPLNHDPLNFPEESKQEADKMSISFSLNEPIMETARNLDQNSTIKLQEVAGIKSTDKVADNMEPNTVLDIQESPAVELARHTQVNVAENEALAVSVGGNMSVLDEAAKSVAKNVEDSEVFFGNWENIADRLNGKRYIIDCERSGISSERNEANEEDGTDKLLPGIVGASEIGTSEKNEEGDIGGENRDVKSIILKEGGLPSQDSNSSVGGENSENSVTMEESVKLNESLSKTTGELVENGKISDSDLSPPSFSYSSPPNLLKSNPTISSPSHSTDAEVTPKKTEGSNKTQTLFKNANASLHPRLPQDNRKLQVYNIASAISSICGTPRKDGGEKNSVSFSPAQIGEKSDGGECLDAQSEEVSGNRGVLSPSVEGICEQVGEGRGGLCHLSDEDDKQQCYKVFWKESNIILFYILVGPILRTLTFLPGCERFADWLEATRIVRAISHNSGIESKPDHNAFTFRTFGSGQFEGGLEDAYCVDEDLKTGALKRIRVRVFPQGFLRRNHVQVTYILLASLLTTSAITFLIDILSRIPSSA